jgi:hypothetical protein
MTGIFGSRKICSRCVSVFLTGTEEHKTAGNCSPIHTAVLISPPQTTTCLCPWKITWEVTTMRLERQSRKPCEAGCEELERTFAAEAFLRFCNAGRYVYIAMQVLQKSNKRCLDFTDTVCFCMYTFVSLRDKYAHYFRDILICFKNEA